MVVVSTGKVGIVVGRLGLVPVLASFEVSVAMDDITRCCCCVFFTFETMALAVAVPFHGCRVDGSSWDCSGAVGSSSSIGKF